MDTGTACLIGLIALFVLFFGRNGGHGHPHSATIYHGSGGIPNSGPGVSGSTSGPNTGCVGLVLMLVIAVVILGLIITGLQP